MKRRVDDHYGKPSAESQLSGLGLFEGAAALEMPEPVRRTEVRAHMRVVEGEPLPSGAEQRDEALEAHRLIDAKRIACEYVRGKLIELYDSRASWDPNPGVTADDTAKLLDSWSHRPRELDELKSQDWRGVIFRGAGWERTGRVTQSKRAGLKATDLPVWKPVRP